MWKFLFLAYMHENVYINWTISCYAWQKEKKGYANFVSLLNLTYWKGTSK